jgi:hypothetical protein
MRWLTYIVGVFVCVPAFAHDPGFSTATLRLDTNRLEAVLVFSIIDTKELVDLDKNQDGKLSKEELDQGAAELQTMAPGALDVKFDGQLVKPTEFRCHFDASDNATVYLSFPVQSFSNLVVRSKWLAMLQPGHKQYLTIQNPDGQELADPRLLSANSDSVTIQMDLTEPKPPSETKKTPFAEFLRMGVRHIWTGYDHLLFLFGLLIVTRNFKSSITIITCFTIAHSISLAAATLNVVPVSDHFSARIVEPAIAASIVYVGIENLIRGGAPKWRWLLTFAFGLIHGLGFASALKERGVGSNGGSIIMPLVSFNLGVEFGQIAIAAVALPLIWKLRSNPMFVARWVPACSVLVALLGAFWFVQRVWF